MEAIRSEKEYLMEALDLESNRLEYDPWLLDDHPLRSYPTECIPGLGAYLDESIGKRKKSFLRAGCLLIGCLAVFQLIRFLPVNTKSLPHELSSPQIHIRPQTGACTFPTLDTRPHALESSLAGGCDGLRTAVWMHDNELQIGNAVAGPDSGVLLGRFGFDPLLVKLDDVAESPSNDNEPTSSQPDSSRTFLLMLDAKTSLHELYPLLVEQLDTLRQRGYLSHWDGGNVVQRSVTVVVTGESSPNSDCVNHSYSDIFWSAVPEGRVTTSDFTKDGLQYLSPFCIV